jgi:hypothetical protein
LAYIFCCVNSLCRTVWTSFRREYFESSKRTFSTSRSPLLISRSNTGRFVSNIPYTISFRVNLGLSTSGPLIMPPAQGALVMADFHLPHKQCKIGSLVKLTLSSVADVAWLPWTLADRFTKMLFSRCWVEARSQLTSRVWIRQAGCLIYCILSLRLVRIH